MSNSRAPTAATPRIAERRARRLAHQAPPGEGECGHRRASLSAPRRSSTHDAATVATAPSGTAIARQRRGHVRADAHEHECRVVPPLEEAVDESFGRQRQHEAEERADARDADAFDEHLQQDAARGEADQAKYANRFAALVHEHDREREQEHRGGDDGDGGDGEMKALEDDERAGRSRLRLRPGRPRYPGVRVLMSRANAAAECRIDERDVDGVHVFGAGGLEVSASRSGRCSRTSRGTLPSLAGSGVGS